LKIADLSDLTTPGSFHPSIDPPKGCSSRIAQPVHDLIDGVELLEKGQPENWNLLPLFYPDSDQNISIKSLWK
jgi:hypothetical protein